MDAVMTDPMIKFSVDLQKKKMDLGKAEVALDQALLLDQGVEGAETRVSVLKREIGRIERTIEAEKRRQAKASVEEKAARQKQEEMIELNIRQQIFDLVQEGDRRISEMSDWGKRMMAAVNAGKGLNTAGLGYELMRPVNTLAHFLGYSLRMFPYMDKGLGGMLGLHDQRYSSTFADPKTTPPPKPKKAA